MRISSSMDHAPLEYTHLQTHTHTHTNTHTRPPPPQVDPEEYRRLKAERPELAGERDPLEYGKAPEVGAAVAAGLAEEGGLALGCVGGGLGRSRGRAGAQASHTVTPSSKHAA